MTEEEKGRLFEKYLKRRLGETRRTWNPEADEKQKEETAMSKVALLEPEVIKDEGITEEYAKLANKLNLSFNLRLNLYLQKEEIPVYNYENVRQFLDNEIAKLNSLGKNIYWNWTYAKAYNKPIPIEALRLMDKIKTEFDENTEFCISDYKVQKPDPFLSIYIKTSAMMLKYIVIYHWDEPGFKAVK